MENPFNRTQSLINWAEGLGIGPDVAHAVILSPSKTEGNGVGDLKEPPVCSDISSQRPNTIRASTHQGRSNDVIGKLAVELSGVLGLSNSAALPGDTDGSAVFVEEGRALNGIVKSTQIDPGEGMVRVVGGGKPQRVTLKCHVTEGVEVSWEATLVDGGKTLLVSVPDKFLPHGSREALVGLLDHAEQKLKCSRVIVYFNKSRSDKCDVVRLFMYLGFSSMDAQALSTLLPFPTPDQLVYMMYEIGLDSTSDDDDDDDYDDDDD